VADEQTSSVAAALAEIANAVARAQAGERVTIDSLGIAIVPVADVDAIGLTDEETEENMIELDR
jgi:antitoxin (DNA-binding transcriptional repressor) of toxin-antitoxin stability system